MSEIADVVTKRANGTATGRTPATTAAAIRTRRDDGTTSRASRPSIAISASGATIEVVALLDAQRLPRREDGDLGDEERRDGERRGGEDARARRETARGEPHREQCREPDDTDVEVELGDVPEQIVADVGDRVAAARRRAVGAEERERRAAAGDRGCEREHDRRAGDAVQRREPPQAQPQVAFDQAVQDRSCERGSEEGNRLRAGREAERADGKEQHLPRRGRPLEREHEREHRQHEERVEGVLGHQRARVEHRGHEHAERCGRERQHR